MRSLISVAISGSSQRGNNIAKRVFCAVMRRVLKFAFTWANHTDGQNGGSLTEGFVTAAVASAVLAVGSS